MNDRTNFGWRPEVAAIDVPRVCKMIEDKYGKNAIRFKSAAPNLVATTPRIVILHDAAKKVPSLGGDWLPSQNQPRGTCTSRGAKRACDLIQCGLIASGYPLDYAPTSHAVLYGAGREHAGMLGGNPDDENNDGCTGSAMAWAASSVGLLRNLDDDDDDNDDKLACLWGAKGLPDEIKDKAKDHLIKRVALVKTFEEARDAILNGFPVTVASNVGYQGIRDSQSVMYSRDKNGVAHRGGSWPHQMVFTGYCPNLAGQGEALLQDQSWGPNEPDGPLGPIPIPSYSFWTLRNDASIQISQGDSWVYSGISGWVPLWYL